MHKCYVVIIVELLGKVALFFEKKRQRKRKQ